MNQSEIRSSVTQRNEFRNQKSEIKFLFNCGRWSARAYLLIKMLKKLLREDAGADVLRNSPCSAHVSG